MIDSKKISELLSKKNQDENPDLNNNLESNAVPIAGDSPPRLSNNPKESDADAKKESSQENNKEQISFLSTIVDNLVDVNKTIESILKFKKDQAPEENGGILSKVLKMLGLGKSKKSTEDDDATNEKKSDSSSIWSKVLKTLGIGLFLIAPALIRFIKEKADSIKKFFESIFEFMSDAFNFITEDIPDFFLNDIPNFFVDKFKSLQEKAQYFINSASIMISEIKKNAGEIIVALGEKIKDLPFDLAKEVGQSIVDFGQELVDDANASIDAATLENDDIEKTQQLQKIAEDYVSQLKQNDKNIKDARVVIDRETGVFNIELSYNEGENKVQKFDFYESMRRGKVIPLSGDGEPISDINELLGTGSRSAYADRAATGAPRADAVSNVNSLVGAAAQRPADKVGADTSTLSASLQVSAPDAVSTSSSSTSFSSESGGAASEGSSSGQTMGGMGGGSTATPAAVPASLGGQSEALGGANLGQTISNESMKATDPSLDVTNKVIKDSSTSKTNVVPTSSKQNIDKNWSIDVVPDPSIIFGSLAEDLFYIRA